MNFLTVRDLRNRPGTVWQQLEEGELVLTSNGKPVGLLIGVDEGDLEETLEALRRARASLAVSRMRRNAQSAGLDELSDSEIDAEIRAARRRGRSRS